ncbi:MAG: response regulator [Aphanocapsa lilacina HA4352-LM1]|nr:response regulator [Aphanocapsa lilacina HA4352-LM1]
MSNKNQFVTTFVLLDRVRVLLAEDSEDLRELLVLVFESSGAEVRAVASGSEAYSLFRCWRPDVLISNIAMPGEDGYVLIAKVRALPPEQGGRVPAVAVTAFTQPGDAARSRSAGFQAHLTKPVDLEQLVELAAHLAGRETG